MAMTSTTNPAYSRADGGRRHTFAVISRSMMAVMMLVLAFTPVDAARPAETFSGRPGKKARTMLVEKTHLHSCYKLTN